MGKILTVLVSTNLIRRYFCCKKKLLTFFFSKNISVYAIFNDQRFNDTLTNDIVSFEQLGLACWTIQMRVQAVLGVTFSHMQYERII